MIQDYIREIHKKPEPHRRKVAYISSGVITLLIALVWVTSFGYLHGLNQTGEYIADENVPTETLAVTDTEVRGPFSVFGSNVASGYNAVRGLFGLKPTNSTNEDETPPTLEYVPE